jgi:hypothetical protein
VPGSTSGAPDLPAEAPSGAEAGAPGSSVPSTRSRRGSSSAAPKVSAARTANPSMLLRGKPGTSTGARTSAARTRPSAAASGTSSAGSGEKSTAFRKRRSASSRETTLRNCSCRTRPIVRCRPMRLLVLLLLIAGVDDLTPREGSGWAGFETGAWVRMKNSRLQTGRMLAPTITKITLAKADEKSLTLSIETENALGVAPEAQKWTVPATGEAGAGEKQKEEGSGEEEVAVGDKRVACDRVQVTVTGATGKRVVTRWIARDPKAVVKRVTVTTDVDGKETGRDTMLLQSLVPEERSVGSRRVRCVKYATERKDAGYEFKGTAYLSRDVPGGVVFSEDEISKDGTAKLTQRVEVLDFGTK